MKGVGPGHINIDKRNSDFLIEVAKENIPGHSLIQKFGHASVGTTIAPITESGFYRTPLSAVSLEFVSDSADDTADGTGAREIFFEGIGADYKFVTQTVATGGLVPSALPTPLLRLTRWWVSGSGTYGTVLIGAGQVGTLTIRVAGAGETWSETEPTPLPRGQSEIGCYTVPDGFTAYIVESDIDSDSSKAVDVLVCKREGIDIVTAPFSSFRTLDHFVGLTGGRITILKAPPMLPAKTDLVYMGKVSVGTADISVHMTLLLVADGH